MYNYRREVGLYSYKKNLGLGAIDFPIVLYRYPSYLGVDILTVDSKDMPSTLLGFTNGHSIIIKEGIRDIEDFVLLHEEEHVKDMSVSEMEVDKRALKRLLAKNVSDKKLESVLKLLEKRWNIKIPEPDAFF